MEILCEELGYCGIDCWLHCTLVTFIGQLAFLPDSFQAVGSQTTAHAGMKCTISQQRCSLTGQEANSSFANEPCISAWTLVNTVESSRQMMGPLRCAPVGGYISV
jgi:hypothetical protein